LVATLITDGGVMMTPTPAGGGGERALVLAAPAGFTDTPVKSAPAAPAAFAEEVTVAPTVDFLKLVRAPEPVLTPEQQARRAKLERAKAQAAERERLGVDAAASVKAAMKGAKASASSAADVLARGAGTSAVPK
jgi:hypothetical protein